MAKVRIELNSTGIREMLKSAEMEAMLQQQASAIAGRCGSGYASDTKQMQTRVIALAYAETPEAYRDNLQNNTLLKALGGGGG